MSLKDFGIAEYLQSTRHSLVVYHLIAILISVIIDSKRSGWIIWTRCLTVNALLSLLKVEVLSRNRVSQFNLNFVNFMAMRTFKHVDANPQVKELSISENPIHPSGEIEDREW